MSFSGSFTKRCYDPLIREINGYRQVSRFYFQQRKFLSVLPECSYTNILEYVEYKVTYCPLVARDHRIHWVIWTHSHLSAEFSHGFWSLGNLVLMIPIFEGNWNYGWDFMRITAEYEMIRVIEYDRVDWNQQTYIARLHIHSFSWNRFLIFN